MYIDLEDYIRDLLEKPLYDLEVTNARIAQAEYHNLRAYKDHLGVVRLCSSDVNPIVDTIHILHRTDCDDSCLLIMPHLSDGSLHIFSDPPIFVVGQRNQKGFGEVEMSEWKEMLKDAGISSEVISKVRRYLQAHPPVSYKDVED